jgi:hypothetical protein
MTSAVQTIHAMQYSRFLQWCLLTLKCLNITTCWGMLQAILSVPGLQPLVMNGGAATYQVGSGAASSVIQPLQACTALIADPNNPGELLWLPRLCWLAVLNWEK